MMRITVIGSGYVGTTTALVLANIGHEVIGYDVDNLKVVKLNNGILPFVEPGLEPLLQELVKNKKITFTSDSKIAITQSQILIVAVGTPSTSSGKANLMYLEQVLDVIAEQINEPKIVVTKSTVPLGTNRWMKQQLTEKMVTNKYPIEVISNPEFLREGRALQDSQFPSRTVIGGENREAIQKVKEIYAPLKTSFYICNYETAEMIKYASNGFLATKISFINEIARLADKIGADIEGVAVGMGLDPRISPHHLKAGIGYGGSCFPKDVDELLYSAWQYGVELQLLGQAKQVNRSQIDWFVQKIESQLSLKGKRLLVLGLTFKEDTDDQRESSGIRLIEHLLEKEVDEIRVMDPTITSAAQIQWKSGISDQLKEKVKVLTEIDQAANDVQAVLLTTPWLIFSSYPWKEWVNKTDRALLFDGRNFLNPVEMRSYGWHYVGIARGDLT